MAIEPGDPLNPVAQITCGPVTAIEGVVVRFDFLSHETQSVSAPTPGRNYVLSAVQARYLVQQIERSLQVLESGPPPGTGHPKH